MDGVEQSGVDVGLDLLEAGDHLGVTDDESGSPARHVKCLGEAVKLDADLFGARHLQKRGLRFAVEVKLRVGVVVADDDPVLAREGDDLFEEVERRRGGGGVVGVVEEEKARARALLDEFFELREIRQVVVLEAGKSAARLPRRASRPRTRGSRDPAPARLRRD